MELNLLLYTLSGLLSLVFLDTVIAGVSIHSLHGNSKLQFLDSDSRTRKKRNVTSPDDVINDDKNTTSVTEKPEVTTTRPQWLVDLLNGKYHGSEQYIQRQLYKDNPNTEPTLCFNNVTLHADLAQSHLFHYYCPMMNHTDDMVYCCGEPTEQSCCTKEEFDKEQEEKKNTPVQEIDIVTGISIAAICVVSLMFCMFLYCCCCQRRSEIHDGIKLVWVRRSFGKELNRLDQPAYQDHMTVVNSITGLRESRHGSRHGSRAHSRSGSLRSNRSRQGSFKIGSRNPSATPSPSVSRRASNDHHHGGHHHGVHTGSSGAKPHLHHPTQHTHHPPHHLNKDVGDDKYHLGGDLPSSSVVITVTTPSDEHGPTAPLLNKTAHEGETEQE